MPIFLDKIASLTPQTKKILCEKHTESPWSGCYNRVLSHGSYLCRRCGLALFRANSQFDSACGWPAFDIEIKTSIQQLPDPDGIRTEIQCNRCKGHLGHIFSGEYLTTQNRRYCVNALSLDYVENNEVIDTEEAILAGGCFWGVDYYLKRIPGVLKVETGYTGGTRINPSYQEICAGDTGHYEAVRVIYDTRKTNYTALVKHFFEIHDPTQVMGQGPDFGYQYQSAIFYYNDKQLEAAQALIRKLIENQYEIITKLLPVQIFWPAETYHQDYYNKQGKLPYCHHPVMRFS